MFIYLTYILPAHAYSTVLVYFQGDYLPAALRKQIILGLIVLWFFLIGITFFVARVNKEVASCGPTLGRLFAAKGVFESRKPSSNWVSSSRSFWVREGLKLSSYYEMIWRAEKELAFTVGQVATLNWKFIGDVSVSFFVC